MPHDIAVSMLKAPSFSQAQQQCSMVGGHLATIVDDAQNEQLSAALNAQNQHDDVWIGLTDSAQEGVWQWVDSAAGEPSVLEDGAYSHWAFGQPDNWMGLEHCVDVWRDGGWNDADCNTPKGFACKVRVPPQDMTFPCSPNLRLDASSTCRMSALPTKTSSMHSVAISQEVCTQQLSHSQLAEPRTTEQILLLTGALRESQHDSMWVNLKRGDDGKFKWAASGDPLTPAQSRWATGQPDGDGDCVEMWPDGTWNDRDCTVAKVFACEGR